MDIPIDPALLEEEGGLEDAEGEVDDEYLAGNGYGEYQEGTEQSYPIHLDPTPPTPRASSPRSEMVPSPVDPAIPKKRRGRPPGSLTKNRKSDLHGAVRPLVNGHGHAHTSHHHLKGKGKGKAKAVVKGHLRSDSLETIYAGHPREDYCSFCEPEALEGQPQLRNQEKIKEKMVSCFQCGRSGHPSCLRMTPSLAKYVMTYNWTCVDCKACEICGQADSDVMFCDGCDRGYHHWCVVPALPGAPDGAWYCDSCHQQGRARKHKSTSQIVTQLSEPMNHASQPSPSAIVHPPPLVDTPTIVSRRGRAPKSLPASRLSQSMKWGDNGGAGPGEEEDVFAHRPRVKLKTNSGRKDKGKGRQADESPFIVKIRVPSGGARKAVEVEDEDDKVPFGGIITGADADTTKTAITDPDKARFQKSLSAAESKLGGPALPVPSYDPPSSVRGSPAPSLVNGNAGPSAHAGTSTPSLSRSTSTPQLARGLRDRLLQQSASAVSLSAGSPGPSSTPNGLHLRDRQGGASTSEKIKTIRFGVFDIDTWYSAPYPEEYQTVPDGRLWLCEFCLKYMKSGFVAGRHRMKCKTRHPPGDEIYRDGNISVFEVDGRKNKIYCQNLCLLAKMFLDHKTLYYDVEPFLFYVMTEVDDLGARFVGYFSKEKRSLDNNVSCIMTLPVRQRKGWGQLLIDFSYALSKKEGRVGSPEKPLSGLGEVTYKRYWKITVFDYLRNAPATVTMDDISAATSLTIEDIYATLSAEDMIISLDSPPRSRSVHTPTRARGRGRGRGRGSINRRMAREDTQTDSSEHDKDKPVIPKRYTIRFDRAYVEAVMTTHESRGYLTLKPDRLKYHPFLVTRDPIKPPNTIAKAALTAGTTAAAAASGADEEDTLTSLHGGTEDDPETVNHGQDKATLELVAKLSESPARSLRKRPATSPPDSAGRDRQTRQKRARQTTDLTPRRSTRGAAAAVTGVPDPEAIEVDASPSRAVNGNGSGSGEVVTEFDVDVDGDVDADGEGDVDAEGEDEDGDWEADDADAEGEDEYVE